MKYDHIGELCEQYQFELPAEEAPPSVVANVPPPMRAFSVARSYFGGQKRPSDGEQWVFEQINSRHQTPLTATVLCAASWKLITVSQRRRVRPDQSGY